MQNNFALSDKEAVNVNDWVPYAIVPCSVKTEENGLLQ